MATRTRWGHVLLSAVAATGWALTGMAATAFAGLHLLGADAAGGSPARMAAAVVVLAAGGSVAPSGDVAAFGLEGARAETAIGVMPLGVTLAGALPLALVFLRSLRQAGFTLPGRELCARLIATSAVFVAAIGGLARAGHDVITLDGSTLDTDDIPGVSGAGSTELPGGLGDLGGLLPDRLGDLADAQASVGFTVRTAESLAGGAVWVLAVLLVALLSSRRTPLPRGWDVVHRVVRPAVSAVTGALLVAVLAGWGAAVYAAVGDDQPGRIAGAALLGAPNGAWPAVLLGLLVPLRGRATGTLAELLPAPLDRLLTGSTEQELSLARLAELDRRVWLLALGVAVLMLFAGVLAAVRTPVPRGARVRGLVLAARCAVPAGVATALALVLLVRLSGVSAGASLSVLGVDAFDAGVELHGDLPVAAALGAGWGALAGFAGALLAHASGAAGSRATNFARGTALPGHASGRTYPDLAYLPGPYNPSRPYRAPRADTNPYLRLPEDVHGAPTLARPVPPPPGPPPPASRPRHRDEEGPPAPGAPRGRR